MRRDAVDIRGPQDRRAVRLREARRHDRVGDELGAEKAEQVPASRGDVLREHLPELFLAMRGNVQLDDCFATCVIECLRSECLDAQRHGVSRVGRRAMRCRT